MGKSGILAILTLLFSAQLFAAETVVHIPRLDSTAAELKSAIRKRPHLAPGSWEMGTSIGFERTTDSGSSLKVTPYVHRFFWRGLGLGGLFGYRSGANVTEFDVGPSLAFHFPTGRNSGFSLSEAIAFTKTTSFNNNPGNAESGNYTSSLFRLSWFFFTSEEFGLGPTVVLRTPIADSRDYRSSADFRFAFSLYF